VSLRGQPRRFLAGQDEANFLKDCLPDGSQASQKTFAMTSNVEAPHSMNKRDNVAHVKELRCNI